MRILFITSAWPLGRSYGGQMRALNTANALSNLGTVSVQVVGHDAADEISRRCTEAAYQVHSPIIPQVTPNRGIAGKMRWAFSRNLMNVHGCTASEGDRSRIKGLAREHDLVWVLNGRTPNLLGVWRWSHAHLDIDDLPSTYQRALGHTGDSIKTRWKARLLQRLFRRRELLLRERFQTLSVCSDADREYLGGGDAVHVIPNGFRRPSEAPQREVSIDPPRIGFVGLYSYFPNRDGVRWFIDHCWPLIQKAIPGVRFRLVGEGTDGIDRPKEEGVDALGWMNDPSSEIASWSAMIVPIRAGGGTRIKIADAFSRKCPVVSTELGAFGYGAANGRQLRLADQPEAFAAACIDCIKRPAEAAAMADRAYEEFLEKWTWDAITPRIWAAAEDCLRRSSDLPAPALCT